MNPTEKKPQSRRWMRRIIVLVVVLAISGLALGSVMFGSRGDSAQTNMPTFKVQAGPLTISVTESGTIQAREQIVIKSEVEGSNTILFLVPEGSRVKEGDLLIELDASRFNDQMVDQKIRLQNADAAFVRARENLAVVQSQTESDISRAELDLQFAKQDLEKYVKGEYPNQLNAAESKIALAEAELKRAVEKLQWSTILNQEKYLSKTELEADQLAQRKAQLDLELARQDLELLKQYTHARKLAELRSGVAQAEMALERIRRKAAADIVQANADLKAKEAEYGQQEARLKKIEDQIEKTRIIAPRGGMVVYATSTQANWRGNADPLEEGQTVRERQELIFLPTADAMMAKVRVHEGDLDKVAVNMPVRITVDALPGQLFTGRTARIAPLPDAASMFMNPELKVYETEVHIDGGVAGLRTGMSCKVEIIAQRHGRALFVPVQALTRRGAQPMVFVKSGASFVERLVKIGLDNRRMVHIIEGLEEGEEVLLTPPLATAAVQRPEGESDDEEEAGGAGSSNDLNNAADSDRSSSEPAGAAAPAAADEAAPVQAAPAGEAERTGRGSIDPSSLTPEQREQMRQRFQNMSPEERQRLREQRGGAGGAGRGEQAGASQRGGTAQ